MTTTAGRLGGRLEVWELSNVRPYPGNAKRHTEDQVRTLAGILARDGWDQPIVVDKDGVIIKGHCRRLSAMHNGWDKVPVLVRDDLNQAQVRAARLSDNQVASLGEIDQDILQREIAALLHESEGELTIGDMGFSELDLDMDAIGSLLSDLEGEGLPLDDEGLSTPPGSSEAHSEGNPEGGKDYSKPDLSKEVEYRPKFILRVECPDEGALEALYNRLTEEGFACDPQQL
jgi:hypothetical protein